MIERRPLLAGLALALLGGHATGMAMEEAHALYGMIGKIKAKPGMRAALLAILAGGTAAMPGCLAYIVGEDVRDADGIWISEVWDSKASHDASLALPAVKAAIAEGRPMIAGFETSAETRVLPGFGR